MPFYHHLKIFDICQRFKLIFVKNATSSSLLSSYPTHRKFQDVAKRVPEFFRKIENNSLLEVQLSSRLLTTFLVTHINFFDISKTFAARLTCRYRNVKNQDAIFLRHPGFSSLFAPPHCPASRLTSQIPTLTQASETRIRKLRKASPRKSPDSITPKTGIIKP